MPETIETAIPPALPGEVVMSRAEVARSRKPGLRELMCRSFANSQSTQTWRCNGRIPSRENAVYETVQFIFDDTLQETTLFYIEDPKNILGMAVEPPKPGEPVRKSNIFLMVDPNLAAMLKAAPLNETFRARLMAKLGEMPPKEVDTWDKIKDWVEFNFPKTVPVKPGSPAPPRPGITIAVDASETESGTCRYTRQLQGSDDITLSADTLIELAENADGGWDGLLDAVYEQVREIAYENISMDTVEDSEETERHAPNGDGDGINLDYSTRTLKERLATFMRANLSREQLDNFGL